MNILIRAIITGVGTQIGSELGKALIKRAKKAVGAEDKPAKEGESDEIVRKSAGETAEDENSMNT